MNKTVWKFPVPLQHQPARPVMIPLGAHVVHVGHDPGDPLQPCIWVELHPDEDRVERHFTAYATGAQVPWGHEHVGSMVSPPFAWHVYEKPQLNPGGDY